MIRRLILSATALAFVAVAAPRFSSAAGLSQGAVRSSVKLYDSQADKEDSKGNPEEARHLREKLIRVATDTLNQGLAKNPEDPDLNTLVAKALCKLDKPKEAGEHFAAGAAGLAKRGDTGKAKRTLDAERYNCWIKYRNEGVEAFAEGQKLMSGSDEDKAKSKDDFTKSVDALGHALEIDPTKTEIYPQVAFSHIFSGNKDEGREVLVKALAGAPGDTDLVRNLAAVDLDIAQSIAATDFDRSVTLLNEADSLEHSSVAPFFQIANMYATRAAKQAENSPGQRADYTKAAEYYEKIITRFPADYYKTVARQGVADSLPEDQYFRDALFNLGVTYYSLKRYDDVVRIAEHSLYLDPRNAELYNLHRAAVAAKKNMDAATRDFLVVQALQKGKKADPAARAASASGDMAAAKSAHGVPAEVYAYTDGQTKATIETWFYWKDGVAITFVSGKKLNESPIPKLQS